VEMPPSLRGRVEILVVRKVFPVGKALEDFWFG